MLCSWSFSTLITHYGASIYVALTPFLSLFLFQAEVGTFPTDLCGCCAVKDCGCGCCLKLYCCFQCNYGSAMEAADLGACCLCCCCFSMFTQCVGCYNRGRLVEKYNIQESQCMSCLVYFFCPCCAAIQDMNLVCHKENKCVPCPLGFGCSCVCILKLPSQDLGLLCSRRRLYGRTKCGRHAAQTLSLGRAQALKDDPLGLDPKRRVSVLCAW